MSLPPRIPPLARALWSDEAHEAAAILEREVAATDEEGATLSATLAHYPELTRAFYTFGHHLLCASSLPDRARELVTLRVASRYRCDYEWVHHVAFVKRMGFSDAEVRAVIAGPEAAVWSDADRDVLLATDQMCATTRLDDAIWERLTQRFDRRQVMDLLFTIGNYVMLAMVLNTTRVPVERDFEGFRFERYEAGEER